MHFVDEHFDTGKTLAQRVVPVLPNDTPEQLAARVLHEVTSISAAEIPPAAACYIVVVIYNSLAANLPLTLRFQEHHVYVEAVAALCEDRIVWREDGVPLIRTHTNPDTYT